MDIKTIPLSRLEANPGQTLNECADSGQPIVVELPDHRLIALQPLSANHGDDLIDELISSNAEFRELIERSKSSGRKRFVPSSGT